MFGQGVSSSLALGQTSRARLTYTALSEVESSQILFLLHQLCESRQALAERLYADLPNKGVRCWYAPEDMKIGDAFRSRFGVREPWREFFRVDLYALRGIELQDGRGSHPRTLLAVRFVSHG
jgi:hypothetical protein